MVKRIITDLCQTVRGFRIYIYILQNPQIHMHIYFAFTALDNSLGRKCAVILEPSQTPDEKHLNGLDQWMDSARHILNINRYTSIVVML